MNIFTNIVVLLVSLWAVIKSAEYAVKYSSKLAQGLKLPKHVVGFLLVAMISALPEMLISVDSAFKGEPALGLGTLFGSNIIDLTLVFSLVVIISRRSINVQSKFIDTSFNYLVLLTLPIIFGLNGYYSRLEGALLVISGLGYYYSLLRKEKIFDSGVERKISWKHLILFIASIIILLITANITATYGLNVAHGININPTVIGIFIIALGVALPELVFSIQAAKEDHDGMAIGDILGNVLTDATIVIGTVALICPFEFNKRIVYITGVFMLISAIILLYLMRTGKALARRESWILIIIYMLFVLVELGIFQLF